MQYLLPQRLLTGFLIVLMFQLSGVAVSAQEQTLTTQLTAFSELTDHKQQLQTIWVPLYKSHILELNSPVSKISIGNPDIADILIMQSGQLYILGRGLGTTNVLLWDRKNRLISAFDIEVTHDLATLKAKLYQLLPEENVKVHSSQGAIVLSGQISSLTRMNTAVQLAESFARPTKSSGEGEAISSVVNLMSIGGAQQVMLKVTVAEISRSVFRKMGINFVAGKESGNFIVGALSTGGKTFSSIPSTLPSFTAGSRALFANYADSGFIFNMLIEAAKQNGSAKVLAEPTLTTLSGQEATFLSGGEFPIPVPSDDGISIEFKDFGIGLNFIPVVLDDDQINLKLNISVSELTNVASVTLPNSSADFFVPALTKRSASATVELADGQTIGIAGLINENMREVINKFPGLGDIPILGNLFRSQEFEKGETELVIMVTPILAKPIDPDKINLPTDNFIEPSDTEFYLLGKNLGTPKKQAEDSVSNSSSQPATEPTTSTQPASLRIPVGGNQGGMENSYGHTVQ
ncbi:MAG: type II and III secretion system protein family protein [Amphritea sp.]|nr:type II and III secretion system protein family protein [Amphritea sp.]MBQ0783694.1 type II and III secretion system protein family protein [Amphritea sp.]